MCLALNLGEARPQNIKIRALWAKRPPDRHLTQIPIRASLALCQIGMSGAAVAFRLASI